MGWQVALMVLCFSFIVGWLVAEFIHAGSCDE